MTDEKGREGPAECIIDQQQLRLQASFKTGREERSDKDFHLIEDFLTNFNAIKLHQERLRKFLGMVSRCKVRRYVDPSSVLMPEIVDPAPNRDVLAFETSQLAQKALKAGDTLHAKALMSVAASLWYDRPEKLVNTEAFFAYLEEDVARFRKAQEMCLKLHGEDLCIDEVLPTVFGSLTGLKYHGASADDIETKTTIFLAAMEKKIANEVKKEEL